MLEVTNADAGWEGVGAGGAEGDCGENTTTPLGEPIVILAEVATPLVVSMFSVPVTAEPSASLALTTSKVVI